MKKFGIVIITIGFLITAVSTYNLIREKEQTGADNFEVTTEESRDVNWTPWVGVAVMAFGGVLYFFAGRKA